MGATVSALFKTPASRALLMAAILLILYSQRYKQLGVVLFTFYTVLSTSLRRLVGRRRVASWDAKIEIYLDVVRFALSHQEPQLIRAVQKIKANAPFQGTIRPFKAKHVTGYWIGEADATDPKTAVLVYFHGGAFMIGSALENKLCYKAIASAMQAIGRPCVVLTVEYSLAPEHPYPQALDDCVEAVAFLQEELHIPAKRLFVGGDSAGGNLAIATALKLRDLQRPQPAALVLLSPMATLNMEYPSARRNINTDLVSQKFGLRGVTAYLTGRNGVADEYVELMAKNNFRGLPPAIVFNGGRELLSDSISEFVQKYNADNNSESHATHVFEKDMFHEWMLFPEIVPKEARVAFAAIAEYMSRQFVPV